VSGSILHTTQKLLAKKGAWTLFHGVWSYGVEVIEFQSFYEFKNLMKLSFNLEKS